MLIRTLPMTKDKYVSVVFYSHLSPLCTPAHINTKCARVISGIDFRQKSAFVCCCAAPLLKVADRLQDMEYVPKVKLVLTLK